MTKNIEFLYPNEICTLIFLTWTKQSPRHGQFCYSRYRETPNLYQMVLGVSILTFCYPKLYFSFCKFMNLFHVTHIHLSLFNSVSYDLPFLNASQYIICYEITLKRLSYSQVNEHFITFNLKCNRSS